MSARSTILTAGAAAMVALLLTVGPPASAAAALANAPVRSSLPAPPPPTTEECFKLTGLECYSPQQLERAYDLGPLYARGFTGRGRTIVIVDPFGSPTIAHDLEVFDHGFGLPAPPSFRIIQPVGPVPSFDAGNPQMAAKAGETTLDVEWSHAIAPGASILLIETPREETPAGGGFPQMIAAENYVVEHNLGDVISQSFSLPEQNFPSRSFILRLRYAYVNALRRNITVLAASNDLGVSGPMATAPGFYLHPVVYWPASDPLVTGVGGTKLHLDAEGVRTAPDTAWNDTENPALAKVLGTRPPLPFASGGGLSTLFGRPAYQDSVRSVVGDHRGVPDISMSGAFSGGVSVYESFPGAVGWISAGGTSEATPEFAGIVAIADQYAGRRLGLINPALYLLEGEHAPGIVDVTDGNNTVSFVQSGRVVTVRGYQAKPGYDLVTGVGTINAARFVPELAELRSP